MAAVWAAHRGPPLFFICNRLIAAIRHELTPIAYTVVNVTWKHLLQTVSVHYNRLHTLLKREQAKLARRTRDTQHAPDGVPPSGNAKDALDTVA